MNDGENVIYPEDDTLGAAMRAIHAEATADLSGAKSMGDILGAARADRILVAIRFYEYGRRGVLPPEWGLAYYRAGRDAGK